MINFHDWRIVENVEVLGVSDESFDWDEEETGLDYQTLQQQAWDIAKQAPINILRDKNLSAVALLNGQVVGTCFTSWNQEEYSFDVIVSPKFQQQGIGKKLIDYAMSMFRWDSDGREGAHIKAEVVNKNLIPLLARMGFKTKGVFQGITVMTYGDE